MKYLFILTLFSFMLLSYHLYKLIEHKLLNKIDTYVVKVYDDNISNERVTSTTNITFVIQYNNNRAVSRSNTQALILSIGEDITYVFISKVNNYSLDVHFTSNLLEFGDKVKEYSERIKNILILENEKIIDNSPIYRRFGL